MADEAGRVWRRMVVVTRDGDGNLLCLLAEAIADSERRSPIRLLTYVQLLSYIWYLAAPLDASRGWIRDSMLIIDRSWFSSVVRVEDLGKVWAAAVWEERRPKRKVAAAAMLGVSNQKRGNRGGRAEEGGEETKSQ